MLIRLTRDQALQWGLLVCKHCNLPPNNHFDDGKKKCATDRNCPGYEEKARVGELLPDGAIVTLL